MRTLRCTWPHSCVLFVSAVALSGSVHAQDPPASPPAGSSDPFALLVRASKLNNLAVDDVQPWHIKASIQLFNDQGSPSGEGTYEEFWVGPKKFKRIFIGKEFSETRYGGEQGDLHADVRGTVPQLVYSVQRELVSPLPKTQGAEKFDLTGKEVEMGGLKLTCLTLAPPMPVATHCVNQSEPILRVSSYPVSSLQVLRNRMLRFQERAIPGDIKLVRAGKTLLTIHVDSVENIADANDALFAAPSDAVQIPTLVQIPGAFAKGMLEYSVVPDYPSAAKDARMEGTVVLQAKIGKEGRLKDITVVSGAKVFQGSAIQAVQQWRYRPYLLSGEPVEVMTTINVIFSLNHSGPRP
jgi:TonB family protein